MSIGRHTLYNLAGSVAPMFVSLVTVPLYLHLIGDARYGVLALVWLFLGYFGLFDPGLGRATSYYISRLHEASDKDRADVFWTALAVNFSLGVIGGLVLYVIAQPLFLSVFKLSTHLRGEVLTTLPWLAASVPIAVMGGVLGGALQAREWFGVQNTVNATNVFVTQAAPLIVAYFHGPDLRWLIPTVIIARLAGYGSLFVVVAAALPLGAGGGVKFHWIRPLFAYGGWITGGNFLTNLVNTLDRMIIASFIGAEALAYYTVSFNLVTKLNVISGALCVSLFPTLSRESTENANRIARNALIGIAAIMTPATAFGVLILPIFMQFWVGPTFASHASDIGVILLIGVWFNGLRVIPIEHLDARSQPKLPVVLNAIELIPFLALLWLSVSHFGIIGGAAAWSCRLLVNTIVLFWLTDNLDVLVRLIPGCIFILGASLTSSKQLFSIHSLLATFDILASLIWSYQLAPPLFNRYSLVFVARISNFLHKFAKYQPLR